MKNRVLARRDVATNSSPNEGKLCIFNLLFGIFTKIVLDILNLIQFTLRQHDNKVLRKLRRFKRKFI